MLKQKYEWMYSSCEGFEYDEKIPFSEMIQKLLYNRGIKGKEDIEAFMNPSKEQLHDPFLLEDMEKAVDRILLARDKREKVAVYGDYDVDGITSTSILYRYLHKIGVDVEFYIPNRMEEGYGINKNALAVLKTDGVNLVITVDTGISAVLEIDYATEIGLEVIITDHHECQEDIPKAYAVINPKRPNSKYPFSMLAGVGVAFKLIHGLATKLGDVESIWEYLDLVAIGTIADIVPLTDENRIIAKFGFERIKETSNTGLKQLLKFVGYKDTNITSGFIGFVIAPRLNAAGRIDDAGKCVTLFITEDEDMAAQIAKELEENNRDRQEIEQQIFNEVVECIEQSNEEKEAKIIILAKENWHHGVIGIVASKIVEKYYKPTILMNIEEDLVKGSARSIAGFSIFEGLENMKNHLLKFGGHDMAAGLSVNLNKFNEFKKEMKNYAEKVITNEMLVPKTKVEMNLDCKDATPKFIDEINKLQPYGVGNSEPLFAFEAKLIDFRLLGKESNHLKLKIKQNNAIIDCIMFNRPEHFENLYDEMDISVVGNLQNNEWNGKVSPQILLKDLCENDKYMELYKIFKESQSFDSKKYDLYELQVSREDIAEIYKYFLKVSRKNESSLEKHKIIVDLNINMFKLLVALDILVELKLVGIKMDDDVVEFCILSSDKVDLMSSNVLVRLNEWINSNNI